MVYEDGTMMESFEQEDRPSLYHTMPSLHHHSIQHCTITVAIAAPSLHHHCTIQATPRASPPRPLTCAKWCRQVWALMAQ